MGKIAIPRAIFSVYVSKWPLVQCLQDGVAVEAHVSSKSVTVSLLRAYSEE